MKKILFIEDEVKYQDSFIQFFRAKGLEVVSAYDGLSALKLAEENVPDLIVLDLVLPRRDGFAVLKELKANPRLATVPVIVLTNLEGAGDIERAIALGAALYLVKANTSLPEVFSRIEATLARSS